MYVGGGQQDRNVARESDGRMIIDRITNTFELRLPSIVKKIDISGDTRLVQPDPSHTTIRRDYWRGYADPGISQAGCACSVYRATAPSHCTIAELARDA